MSYKEIGAPDRVNSPMMRGELGVLELTTYDEAIREAAGQLKAIVDSGGPSLIAGVASAHATNEDLAIFARFLQALPSENYGVAVPTGEDDALLIKKEKAANAVGARALGFGDARAVADRVRGGGIRGLIVMGHDLLEESILSDPEVLSNVDTLIVLDTHHSAMERFAHFVFPTRHAAEKHGTLTNHAGRVQAIRPAVEPAWDARADGEVIALLAAALGLSGFDGKYDVRAASKSLAERQPAFAGIDLDAVGESGAVLAGTGAES